MQHTTFSKFHVDKDEYRHWDGRSERFTGGDALQSMLDQGWRITGDVMCEEHWLSGSRRAWVYHFKLRRENTLVRMRVIRNPFVMRLMLDLECRVLMMDTQEVAVLTPEVVAVARG